MKALTYIAESGVVWIVGLLNLVAVCIAGWVTHVVVTIQYLVGGGDSIAYAALLIVGAFMAPVGMIHGWGVWFGAW